MPMDKKGRTGGPEHERVLREKAAELETEGWRVILLQGKSPDGIAVNGAGRIVAIEVVAKVPHNATHKAGKGRYRLQGGVTFSAKRAVYAMFDDVIFATYHRDRPSGVPQEGMGSAAP